MCTITEMDHSVVYQPDNSNARNFDIDSIYKYKYMPIGPDDVRSHPMLWTPAPEPHVMEVYNHGRIC